MLHTFKNEMLLESYSRQDERSKMGRNMPDNLENILPKCIKVTNLTDKRGSKRNTLLGRTLEPCSSNVTNRGSSHKKAGLSALQFATTGL